MSCPDYGHWPAIVGWLLLVIVTGAALSLVESLLAWLIKRPKPREIRLAAMRTASAARIQRETAALQATPGATTNAVVDLRDAARTAMTREARRAAEQDYRGPHRRRANPHPRHSRQFAAWAIEYAARWTELEGGPQPPAPNPHSSGHGAGIRA